MASEVPGRSRAHGLVLGFACVVPVLLFALARWLEPDPRGFGTHEQLGFQPCYPMVHWSLPCPACGVTTALAHAARGEWLAALRVQPLGPLLAAVALASGPWALGQHLRGRDLAGQLARLPWRAVGQVSATLALLAWLYKLADVRGWL